MKVFALFTLLAAAQAGTLRSDVQLKTAERVILENSCCEYVITSAIGALGLPGWAAASVGGIVGSFAGNCDTFLQNLASKGVTALEDQINDLLNDIKLGWMIPMIDGLVQKNISAEKLTGYINSCPASLAEVAQFRASMEATRIQHKQMQEVLVTDSCCGKVIQKVVGLLNVPKFISGGIGALIPAVAGSCDSLIVGGASAGVKELKSLIASGLQKIRLGWATGMINGAIDNVITDQKLNEFINEC
jgi:hypothetical protein